jgi:RNA polymerase sigma-70 factor (ECF subfamily)
MNMTLQQEIQLKEILTLAHQNYKKDLSTRAYFKVNNYETSKDLVQQTFMRTWIYLVRGGKIETMKAFLYHILNNLIVDEYRKHKTSSLDVLLEKGFEPRAVEEEKILDTFDCKAAIPLVNLLPETYKRVMRMRYVDDLSLKEISETTRQTQNTVAVQIHRGIAKLKLLYNH